MSKIDTGGPAFPRPFHETVDGNFSIAQTGMTLRDYVATAMAPHFMELMQELAVNGKISSKDAARFAAMSTYEFADAMVAARGEVT